MEEPHATPACVGREGGGRLCPLVWTLVWTLVYLCSPDRIAAIKRARLPSLPPTCAAGLVKPAREMWRGPAREPRFTSARVHESTSPRAPMGASFATLCTREARTVLMAGCQGFQGGRQHGELHVSQLVERIADMVLMYGAGAEMQWDEQLADVRIAHAPEQARGVLAAQRHGLPLWPSYRWDAQIALDGKLERVWRDAAALDVDYVAKPRNVRLLPTAYDAMRRMVAAAACQLVESFVAAVHAVHDVDPSSKDTPLAALRGELLTHMHRTLRDLGVRRALGRMQKELLAAAGDEGRAMKAAASVREVREADAPRWAQVTPWESGGADLARRASMVAAEHGDERRASWRSLSRAARPALEAAYNARRQLYTGGQAAARGLAIAVLKATNAPPQGVE